MADSETIERLLQAIGQQQVTAEKLTRAIAEQAQITAGLVAAVAELLGEELGTPVDDAGAAPAAPADGVERDWDGNPV
ncbi:hypothetical protein LJR143_002194 [Pseudoxanthomonas sp. LjRoot143]|uniref:hypothetical protein n=1 Tax=Pseudoxanthomonas sp. LjRoot143 TaxID=3342266 RepID=UPI003ECE5A6F